MRRQCASYHSSSSPTTVVGFGLVDARQAILNRHVITADMASFISGVRRFWRIASRIVPGAARSPERSITWYAVRRRVSIRCTQRMCHLPSTSYVETASWRETHERHTVSGDTRLAERTWSSYLAVVCVECAAIEAIANIESESRRRHDSIHRVLHDRTEGAGMVVNRWIWQVRYRCRAWWRRRRGRCWRCGGRPVERAGACHWCLKWLTHARNYGMGLQRAKWL